MVGEDSESFQLAKRQRKSSVQVSLQSGLSIEEIKEKWPQCCFYMERKRRFCNMARTAGTLYCGIHQVESTTTPRLEREMKRQSNNDQTEIKRVPCPVDPSHTVYIHRLEQHVKVCHVKSFNKDLENQGIYCLNCNSVDSNEVSISEENVTSLATVDCNALRDKVMKCFDTFVQPHLIALTDSSDSTDPSAVELTEPSSVHTSDDQQSEIFTSIEKLIAGDQKADDRIRHAKQDVLILEQMIKYKQLPSLSDAVAMTLSKSTSSHGNRLDQWEVPMYLEYGAGRGFLGYCIQLYYQYLRQYVSKQASAGAANSDSSSDANTSNNSMSTTAFYPHLVMLERGGVRHKADKLVREIIEGVDKSTSDTTTTDPSTATNSDVSTVTRYRIDIRHCNLSGVLQEANKNHRNYLTTKGIWTKPSSAASTPTGSSTVHYSVIAKHLCGVATDLTLRSLQVAMQKQENEPHAPATPGIDQSAQGLVTQYAPDSIAIATCCHHACNYEDYVGKEWLSTTVGITEQEFQILVKWSGWATLPVADPLTDGSSRSSRNKTTEEHAGSVSVDGEDEHQAPAEATDTNDTTSNMQYRPQGITRQEMIAVGRAVKCLFDYGRLLYIKDTLQYRQVYYTEYCTRALTPECRLLVAKR